MSWHLTDTFKYFFSRTLWRPRDIISFINLCVNEAIRRHSNRIDQTDVFQAESIYSRQRKEALTDEWKYVYPELNRWIDVFAGAKSKFNYTELEYFLRGQQRSSQLVIDILYSVGFLGFMPYDKRSAYYSFSSKFATPIKNSTFFINRTFIAYLKDRGEELGKAVMIDERTDEEGFPEYSTEEHTSTSDKKHQDIQLITINSPVRVLAVFANPKGTDPLRLSEEDRVLNECINMSKLRDSVKLKIRHAAQIHDMRRSLLDDTYDVVHFSGHGTGCGLAFEDAMGNIKLVPQKALAELLSAYCPPLKCVILNACYTETQGEQLSLGIPYTIFIKGSIADEAAIEFTRGFYDALCAGRDIAFAFDEGCRCISLAGFSDECKPVLLYS
jgi:hypothetical protein